MFIDYVMSISDHASLRLYQRHKKITEDQILECKVDFIAGDDLSFFIDKFSDKSKKEIEGGFRSIVLFSGLGVIGVVNNSNMELITVFPRFNEFEIGSIKTNNCRITSLKDKVKKCQKITKYKRKKHGFGFEMKRLGDELFKIRSSGDPFNCSKIRTGAQIKEDIKRKVREFALLGEGGAIEKAIAIVEGDMNHKRFN